MCPTGVGAGELTRGRTLYTGLMIWLPKELSMDDISKLKITFDETVGLIIVDEVSMFSAQHFNLMDHRLRTIYDNNKPFGGISIILSGDFLQIEVPRGRELYRVMYVPRDEEERKTRDLFAKFKFFDLTKKLRAQCQIHADRLLAFRKLPCTYPKEDKYTKKDLMQFRPITNEIVKAVMTELTDKEIKQDPGWIENFKVITTGNTEQAGISIFCQKKWFGCSKMETPFQQDATSGCINPLICRSPHQYNTNGTSSASVLLLCSGCPGNDSGQQSGKCRF